MRRFIHALHDEEDGLALITAMMVTFVVFLLSVAVDPARRSTTSMPPGTTSGGCVP